MVLLCWFCIDCFPSSPRPSCSLRSNPPPSPFHLRSRVSHYSLFPISLVHNVSTSTYSAISFPLSLFIFFSYCTSAPLNGASPPFSSRENSRIAREDSHFQVSKVLLFSIFVLCLFSFCSSPPFYFSFSHLFTLFSYSLCAMFHFFKLSTGLFHRIAILNFFLRIGK